MTSSKVFLIPAALACGIALYLLAFANFDTFIFFGLPLLAGVIGALVLGRMDPQRTTADNVTDLLRIYWGLHLIWSASRFWITGTQPTIPHPVGGPFIDALNAMNVFPAIKAMEGIVGIMLVLNRWVPLMLVLEVPTSLTIFYLNFVVVGTPRQLITGPLEIAANCALLLAYFQYYRPFLVMRARAAPPEWLGGRRQAMSPARSAGERP